MQLSKCNCRKTVTVSHDTTHTYQYSGRFTDFSNLIHDMTSLAYGKIERLRHRFLTIVIIGVFLGAILLKISSSSNNGQQQPVSDGNKKTIVKMTLLCRLFAGEYTLLQLALLHSMSVFWNATRFGRLIIILDDESLNDHILGNSLEKEYDWITVKYEKPMSHIYHSGGRSRSQWSNFWSDNYTDKEYIGIVDNDAIMVTLPTESDFFRDGKPIIQAKLGIGGDAWWHKTPRSTQIALGLPEMARCMSYFPVIIKRKHFIMMRAHICKNAGRTDFDEVFQNFSAPDEYSQFSIFCNYLWYFHRDEYEWRFMEDPPGWIKNGHPGVFVGQTNDYSHVNENNTKPVAKVFIHYNYHRDEFDRLHQNNYITQGYCFATNFSDPVICNRSLPLHGDTLHKTLFRFDYKDWLYDEPGCVAAHEEHYRDLTKDIAASLWNMTFIEDFIYKINGKAKSTDNKTSLYLMKNLPTHTG